MKDLEDWAAVQKVYKQTKSKRETAKILGIARNTVRWLLEMDEAPQYRRSVYPSKLDSYKETIIEWRCQPYGFNGTRIFRELKKKGYTGSIGSVYRFLRRVDEDVGPRISSKATVRVETPPGDQAQFDWTEYEVLLNNRYRKVYCFAMILAASRKKAVCFSLKSDAEAIYDAIQELFGDLGGVTLELLIDNPKALVLENNHKTGDEIRYNPHALLMAKHLGTELNACPCYWPRKKGKIERPFNYIEEQFIKGNSFGGMEELNRRGKEFVDVWCNETHTTTKRVPNTHFLLEEKACLQPLPQTRWHMKQMQKRIISPDSYASIGGCKYSVPVQYVGKTVFFRVSYGFRIEIYDAKGEAVLKTEMCGESHGVVTDPSHYELVAPRTSTSIPQIRRDFTQKFSNGARYLESAGRKFDQPTHHARKIMELLELYDDQVLDLFIGMAVDEDKMDIKSFRALLRKHNSAMNGIVQGFPEIPSAVGADAGKDPPGLTRDCGYYEDLAKEGCHADGNQR